MWKKNDRLQYKNQNKETNIAARAILAVHAFDMAFLQKLQKDQIEALH